MNGTCVGQQFGPAVIDRVITPFARFRMISPPFYKALKSFVFQAHLPSIWLKERSHWSASWDGVLQRKCLSFVGNDPRRAPHRVVPHPGPWPDPADAAPVKSTL